MSPQAHPIQPRPRRIVQRAYREERERWSLYGVLGARPRRTRPNVRPALRQCWALLLCGALGVLIAVAGAW